MVIITCDRYHCQIKRYKIAINHIFYNLNNLKIGFIAIFNGKNASTGKDEMLISACNCNENVEPKEKGGQSILNWNEATCNYSC